MARAAGFVEHVENPATGRESRPIDREHLARQCLGDVSLEVEVLRLFDETIARYMGRLVASADADEKKMNLHVIKGAAAGVGAWGVADVAREAEASLREGRPVGTEQVADLAIAVEEVRGYIAGFVAEADQG
ncbi:Hpt domain-containing protein [Devosia nitrariae]|uniref:HPt domain-containing protein n=1 Tax=Devosia nitrariae TaxID=2071872 RepID=A0ABQ5W3X6_9HYPH|nr:Hpt domain-containing protein [Devosia nitrariae]GLQ54630.1 hypothetical protein GCM10010862_18890 [Devosia nitrariae]